MSNIENLYDTIYNAINNHIRILQQRITQATDMQFMQLSGVELFTKLFVSILSTLATGYELIRYFALYKFTEVIPVT